MASIDFTRSRAKVLGNFCNVCINRRVPDTEFILLIDVGTHSLTLCSLHEGLLLEKLITNYLKRKRRNSKVGFLEGIPKEKPQTLLEEVLGVDPS